MIENTPTSNPHLYLGCKNDYWNYLFSFYFIYGMGILSSSSIGRQGGAFVLLYSTIALILVKKIKLCNDRFSLLGLFISLTFVMSCLLNVGLFSLEGALKRGIICLFLCLACSLRLNPVVNSGGRRFFPVLIIGVTALGLLLSGGGGERVRGAFVHTNVMSFFVMLSFMFLSHDKDRTYSIFIHLITIIFVLLTSSLSTVLAYFCGLFFLVAPSLNRKKIIKLFVYAVICLVFAGFTYSSVDTINNKVDHVMERVESQVSVLFQGAAYAISEGDFEHSKFAEQGLNHETSAIWRISYWSLLTQRFLAAPYDKILFGFGPDSVTFLYGIQPHNELIRILFEHGAIGLFFTMAFIVNVLCRIKFKYLYSYVILLTIGLLSNPLDNVFGISLIAFCSLSMVKYKNENNSY